MEISNQSVRNCAAPPRGPSPEYSASHTAQLQPPLPADASLRLQPRWWYAVATLKEQAVKQEAIVSKYIWQLRRSFSLSVLYEFTRECERSKPKAQTLEAYMDELSELAKSPTYDQEFNMAAKKNAAPVPPPAATKAVSKAVKTATQPVKAAPATKDGSPIREPKVPVTAKLRWLVDANPKRVGSASHERCEGYFGAKTVEEFLEGGGTRADLNNDIEKGYVEVV